MNTISVKPGDGLVVRDPLTMKQLPAEGADVPDTAYWRRRLRKGDVVKTPPATKPAQPSAKPAKKE